MKINNIENQQIENLKKYKRNKRKYNIRKFAKYCR